MYANSPLDNDANLDDTAQVHLNNYLRRMICIHQWLFIGDIVIGCRVPLTGCQAMQKIVVLGSCGGYKNLNQIIENCPDAHIISTKEIGTGDINRPIFNYLNQTFDSGNQHCLEKYVGITHQNIFY